MAPRAFLFDLDGTIWDSYPWYARILAEIGGTSAASVLDQLRRGNSIVQLLRRNRVPDSALIRRYSELDLYPRVVETLEELGHREIPRGLVTSLPGRLVLPLLKGLDLSGHFKTVIHAGNCRFRKPDPRPLLTALDGMGMQAAEDTCYVGDLLSDAQAAARAGLAFAWASYGYGERRPTEASVVLKSFAEVLFL